MTPIAKDEEAAAAFEVGGRMMPGAAADVPANRYHVVVTQLGPFSWEWELYRDGEPLPVRLRDGSYKSARTTEVAGRVALREFLEALDREQNV
jgi:hypothetical protein